MDEGRVRRHIDESCITATERADSLVRAEGISFRRAHEVVSRLVREMLERGECAMIPSPITWLTVPS